MVDRWLRVLVSALALVACQSQAPDPPHRMGYAYIPPDGVPTLASQVYHLGGSTYADAGAGSELVDAGTFLVFGCQVCADPANSGTICCAADSAVTCVAGSAHAGTPLSPTGMPCGWFPVKDASNVYCASATASQNLSAQCY